jgi:hypothetical protein
MRLRSRRGRPIGAEHHPCIRLIWATNAPAGERAHASRLIGTQSDGVSNSCRSPGRGRGHYAGCGRLTGHAKLCRRAAASGDVALGGGRLREDAQLGHDRHGVALDLHLADPVTAGPGGFGLVGHVDLSELHRTGRNSLWRRSARVTILSFGAAWCRPAGTMGDAWPSYSCSNSTESTRATTQG